MTRGREALTAVVDRCIAEGAPIIQELPGMIEHSREAYAAGCSQGLSSWRGTFPFGVTVTVQASGIEDAMRRLGPGVLLIEDIEHERDA